MEARPGDEATVTELDPRLEERASAGLKSVAADFHHALILTCKGKALKIVLTNKVGEGFVAWGALVNKYEPTSKASVVGKLAEILRTPFDGDLLDAITTLMRKIMIYEAQSREKISDTLKIGCVIAGMGQNSVSEHLLISATKCDSWTNFVREIESIEHARKTITAPTPVELDAFQGNCHTVREVRTHCERMWEFEPWRSREASMCTMWKETSWCWIRSYTSSHKDSQKGGWKGDRKETAREPRKVESSKEENAETMGREKAEERKDNVPTKSQNHHKNS